MVKKPLTIGSLAKSANVNVETIRYYQRIGLVIEPTKPLEGFRIYPEETISQIRFIKRAQKLGFSLQDIAQLLALGDAHCDNVREQTEAKLLQIETQIKDLQAMRKTLKKLITECSSNRDNRGCPIVQTLAQDDAVADEADRRQQ